MSTLTSLISLPPDVQRLSINLAEEFWREGEAELFLVGGVARDLLLGAPVGHDVDFATSATPHQTERALKAANAKVFKIGEKFGIKVCEVATPQARAQAVLGRGP